MNIKEIKKQFRQKCKDRRTISYCLSLLGGIMVVLGLLTTLLTRIFVINGLIAPPNHLTLFVVGCSLAVIGLMLYLIGETLLKRNFDNYMKFIKRKK